LNAGAASKGYSSAMGACGPVIINGIPYGEVNKFSNGVVAKNNIFGKWMFILLECIGDTEYI
jgi:hypothetical protein